MANQINVTACDNELIIIAFQWGVSYELCRILSGNSQPVSVTLNLNEDIYTGGVTLHGVNNPLKDTVDITLPTGQYSLLLCGIDWGGPSQFTGTITDNTGNTTPFNYSGNPTPGVVWSSVYAFNV